jgi:hypothetical protein
VLLVLALVLLAIVSAIVAFDRWPESGSASSVERIAVDRSEARRVETELVRVERTTAVVRGVVAVRDGSSATASGADGAFLVVDRGPGDQTDGGGFGPPPPPVPISAPGEGGGPNNVSRVSTSDAAPPSGCSDCESPDAIQRTACGATEALGQAGTPLKGACKPRSRDGVVQTVDSIVAADELSR